MAEHAAHGVMGFSGIGRAQDGVDLRTIVEVIWHVLTLAGTALKIKSEINRSATYSQLSHSLDCESRNLR